MKVCVIGAGIAGTAAAWILARASIDVVIVYDRAGASSLYSGALDLLEWCVPHEDAALDPDLDNFAQALGIWQLGPMQSRVATSQGIVRTARGRDKSLLELGDLSGKRVAVADVGRDDFDAQSLAKQLASADWSIQTRTRFEAAPLAILQNDYERHVGIYDFAKQFDDDARIQRVTQELSRSLTGFDAWLFGPWLGVERNVAEILRSSTGKYLGETTSPLGGPAGARFELARDKLFEQYRILRIPERVSVLETNAAKYHLKFESKKDAEPYDAVVLAIGGVAAGGIVLEPSFARRGGAGFRSSLSAELPISLDGSVLDGMPSVWGFDFTAHGLATLERVGIATADGSKVLGARDLYAAGDCAAAQPRTALGAALSGINAARVLLRDSEPRRGARNP